MMNNPNYRGGNSRPNRRNFGPVPVREGETYDVTIEGIGEKGDGIAKIQGFVIVVPNTQQGQRIKVRITAVRGKVSFAEVVGEASPAPTLADGQPIEQVPKNENEMEEESEQ